MQSKPNQHLRNGKDSNQCADKNYALSSRIGDENIQFRPIATKEAKPHTQEWRRLKRIKYRCTRRRDGTICQKIPPQKVIATWV
jgi:hypothetical protein